MTKQEIRQQLSEFNLVQCGLYHENILMDPETKEPCKNISSNEVQYLRVKLCPMEVRSKRLGCAHSISNKRFEDLMDELKSNDSEILELKNEFNTLFCKIYKLDHVKGELDKELIIHDFDKSEESRDRIQIKQDLQNSIETHNQLINELGILKEKLLKRVDQLILLEKG